eukprot:557165-Pelagomonas_calceolata.AAC.1
MGPSGLNYPAILDCAIDIARAMLHLHCNNVLHMDLKARNILLASSGTEGRGVRCKKELYMPGKENVAAMIAIGQET